jgi:hypothetical protein
MPYAFQMLMGILGLMLLGLSAPDVAAASIHDYHACLKSLRDYDGISDVKIDASVPDGIFLPGRDKKGFHILTSQQLLFAPLEPRWSRYTVRDFETDWGERVPAAIQSFVFSGVNIGPSALWTLYFANDESGRVLKHEAGEVPFRLEGVNNITYPNVAATPVSESIAAAYLESEINLRLRSLPKEFSDRHDAFVERREKQEKARRTRVGYIVDKSRHPNISAEPTLAEFQQATRACAAIPSLKEPVAAALAEIRQDPPGNVAAGIPDPGSSETAAPR